MLNLLDKLSMGEKLFNDLINIHELFCFNPSPSLSFSAIHGINFLSFRKMWFNLYLFNFAPRNTDRRRGGGGVSFEKNTTNPIQA